MDIYLRPILDIKNLPMKRPLQFIFQVANNLISRPDVNERMNERTNFLSISWFNFIQQHPHFTHSLMHQYIPNLPHY